MGKGKGKGKANAKAKVMAEAKRQRQAAQRDDWDGWLNELENERPRAAAIVGAAFLDARLEELLESFFVDDHEARRLLNGPLGNFGSRIGRPIVSASFPPPISRTFGSSGRFATSSPTCCTGSPSRTRK